MLATLTPTPTATAHTDTQTIEFIAPNLLRCHCQEYHVNHFCLHLVFYTATKIQAFAPELRASAQNARPKGKG